MDSVLSRNGNISVILRRRLLVLSGQFWNFEPHEPHEPTFLRNLVKRSFVCQCGCYPWHGAPFNVPSDGYYFFYVLLYVMNNIDTKNSLRWSGCLLSEIVTSLFYVVFFFLFETMSFYFVFCFVFCKTEQSPVVEFIMRSSLLLFNIYLLFRCQPQKNADPIHYIILALINNF